MPGGQKDTKYSSRDQGVINKSIKTLQYAAWNATSTGTQNTHASNTNNYHHKFPFLRFLKATDYGKAMKKN